MTGSPRADRGAGRPREVRILALATNSLEGASTRFRLLQWIPYLAREGFRLRVEPFYGEGTSGVIYGNGRYIPKAWHFVAGAIRRWRILSGMSRSADLLLIHREMFPLGWRFLLGRVRSFAGPVVYDYDDAMFLPQRQGRGILSRVERLDTPARVMAVSDVVFAGNAFLAEYARPRARRVVLLPTCVDAERFRPVERPRDAEACVVGWIGSHSTVKYLESLAPVLERVGAEHRFRLYVVGALSPLRTCRLPVTHAAWSLAREADDFRRCDIGVYPLWDDPWAQGKCGFKAIQFMACGVPVVAAAVGGNQEIIQDGVNGFLAASEEEWVEKLGRLLSDPGLREKLGQAGRRTVEERYSLEANAGTLITEFREAMSRSRGAG